MKKTYIPENYHPQLDRYDMQRAISCIKQTFQKELSAALNLKRVSAPLFVTEASGLNDNLSGVERPVSFDIPAVGADAQIVHSLAKWKRLALKRYGFKIGEGLYTDMNAIRRDEELDNLHSIYVDQWDWEKIITEETRNEEYLRLVVKAIVKAICDTNDHLRLRFPQLKSELKSEVTFVTTQQLEDLYPNLTPSERENAFVKEHKTVFIMKIGGVLRSGKPHDNRAPDYDDWNLNGDIFFWDETLNRGIEISSMGIRVNAETLDKQLKVAGCDDRRELMFHKMLLENKLPLTVGGGIGQSRLCMLILGACHIGEVQSSIWDEHTVTEFEKAGITLL